MVMESNLSGSVTHSDFAFAFNDANFSDRLLRIEITGSGEVSCSSVVDLVRNRKRKREDSNKETTSTEAGLFDFSLKSPPKILGFMFFCQEEELKY